MPGDDRAAVDGLSRLMDLLALGQHARLGMRPGSAVERQDQHAAGWQVGSQQAAQGDGIQPPILHGRIDTRPAAPEQRAGTQLSDRAQGTMHQQGIEHLEEGIAALEQDRAVDGLTKGDEVGKLLSNRKRRRHTSILPRMGGVCQAQAARLSKLEK